jgi:hypothetical protein
MEYLRQIEEDLQTMSGEAGKKYPEVLDASNRALAALKIIRETYVSEIRKRDNSNISVHFKTSSEIVAPYILVCNHVECSQKTLGLAINGLLMLLKYDIVPADDVQNILRVVHIQVTSSKCEFQLKILQLLVALVTLIIKDPNNYNLVTEQSIASFLTVSLMLTDNKQQASISTAAIATTRQVIAIMMNGILAASKSLQGFDAAKSPSGGNEKDGNIVTPEQKHQNDQIVIWIMQSTTLIVRELSLFMQGAASTVIKLNHMVSQTFAMDVIYDLLHGWKDLFHSLNSLKLQLHNAVIPSLQMMLKNIHNDFHANHMKFGLTTASSFTARVLQIVRFILLEFWLTDDMAYDDYEHIITLLIHGMLPMRDLSPADLVEEGRKSGSFNRKNTNAGANTNANEGGDLMGIRGRIEEASSLISKFSPFPLSSSATNKQSNSSNNANAGSTGNKNASNNQNSSEQDAYVHIGRSNLTSGLLSSSLTAPGNDQLLPAHPAACCLEVLLSLLLSRSWKMLKTDMGMRCIMNLISQLTIYSSNLVISILSNEQNVK